MAIDEKLLIKIRILGVLLRDARQAAGRSTKEAAQILSISEDDYKAFEFGQQAPSLPQLEVLAYFFNVPIEHFWGADTLAAKRGEDEVFDRVAELLMLRQRIIGVRMRQLRESVGLSLEDVAEQTGHEVRQLAAVERGQASLPINELQMVTRALRANLKDLVEGHGQIGQWLRTQEEFDAFAELPAELREFILKPINRSYIDLAYKMSEMNVDRLRTIAESILEITY
ncbi:MAG: helix-turn-helix domain-containing protein [Anaerolineae bacterium]